MTLYVSVWCVMLMCNVNVYCSENAFEKAIHATLVGGLFIYTVIIYSVEGSIYSLFLVVI